jgi:predicted ATPase
MRKLLVTGAHSTGKTSLVRAIVGDMASIGRTTFVVTDIARECPFPIGLGQTDRSTLWLLHQQVAEELRAEAAGADWIVCDRGVPDILAHWTDICLRNPIGSKLMEGLYTYMALWSLSYTYVFLSLADGNIPLEPDGLREVDPEYRCRIEELITKELCGLGVSFVALPAGLDDRRATLKAFMER